MIKNEILNYNSDVYFSFRMQALVILNPKRMKTKMCVYRFDACIHHRSIMLSIISGVRSPLGGASDSCTSCAATSSWASSSI